MSENYTGTRAAAESSAPAKPKRPKARSLLMIGEQTNALFESARLSKEQGEMVGWSASIFPQEIAETLGLVVLYPENHTAGIAARHQPTLSCRSVRARLDTQATCAPMQN